MRGASGDFDTIAEQGKEKSYHKNSASKGQQQLPLKSRRDNTREGRKIGKTIVAVLPSQSFFRQRLSRDSLGAAHPTRTVCLGCSVPILWTQHEKTQKGQTNCCCCGFLESLLSQRWPRQFQSSRTVWDCRSRLVNILSME